MEVSIPKLHHLDLHLLSSTHLVRLYKISHHRHEHLILSFCTQEFYDYIILLNYRWMLIWYLCRNLYLLHEVQLLQRLWALYYEFLWIILAWIIILSWSDLMNLYYQTFLLALLVLHFLIWFFLVILNFMKYLLKFIQNHIKRWGYRRVQFCYYYIYL